MTSNVAEQLCRKYYFARRTSPSIAVTITKETMHETTVLRLKKPKKFEIEIWATHPRADLDEDIFKHALKAQSTTEAVSKLRSLTRRVSRECEGFAVGLRDLTGELLSEDLCDERDRIILCSTFDLTTLRRSRRREEILNRTAGLPFPPSYVLLESSQNELAQVHVFYLLRTKLVGLSDQLAGFTAEEIITQHFGSNVLSMTSAPENLGSFLPAMGTWECPRKIPYVQVADLTVTGNDQLLVQLAGEQRWGTER